MWFLFEVGWVVVLSSNGGCNNKMSLQTHAIHSLNRSQGCVRKYSLLLSCLSQQKITLKIYGTWKYIYVQILHEEINFDGSVSAKICLPIIWIKIPFLMKCKIAVLPSQLPWQHTSACFNTSNVNQTFKMAIVRIPKTGDSITRQIFLPWAN